MFTAKQQEEGEQEEGGQKGGKMRRGEMMQDGRTGRDRDTAEIPAGFYPPSQAFSVIIGLHFPAPAILLVHC